MSDHSEEVYGPDRAERLLAMLRALAERIQALDRTGRLLERAPELQKLMGNARSELFHYEVRVTYDTPEIAEGRRIVDRSRRRTRSTAIHWGRIPRRSRSRSIRTSNVRSAPPSRRCRCR